MKQKGPQRIDHLVGYRMRRIFVPPAACRRKARYKENRAPPFFEIGLPEKKNQKIITILVVFAVGLCYSWSGGDQYG
jgi:hypothetical protein